MKRRTFPVCGWRGNTRTPRTDASGFTRPARRKRDDLSTAAGQEDKEIHDLRLEMLFGLPLRMRLRVGCASQLPTEVRSGGRTSLPAGHGRIVNVFVPS